MAARDVWYARAMRSGTHWNSAGPARRRSGVAGRVKRSLRRTGVAATLSLGLVGCGATQSSVSAPERIRALAADEFACELEGVGLEEVGEGDSSTGEVVTVYRAVGCDKEGRYFCDADGCQRDGDISECIDPNQYDLYRTEGEPVRLDGRPDRETTSYDFDGRCAPPY